MRDLDWMDWLFAASIVALILAPVGIVWATGAAAQFDASELAYVQTHDCKMVERVEGYTSTTFIMVGKVMVPSQVYDQPRGLFSCTDGTEHWVPVR